MLSDPAGSKLLLEIRDSEKHEVSFTAIDLNEKRLMWDGLSFEESWWIGMSALQDDVLLLHQYEDSQNPENSQLFAVDVNSCEVLWAVTDFTFLNIVKGKVIGFTRKEEERYYSTIELKSGEIAAAGSLTAQLLEQNAQQEAQQMTAGRFPLHYPEDNEYFATFRTFLEKQLGVQVVKACDYLEYGGLILISYYLYKDKSLTNYMVVFDQQGRALLHEKLDSQLPAVGMDTFFVINDQLIFICDKKEIKSYAL
jgi:hypothetical protein